MRGPTFAGGPTQTFLLALWLGWFSISLACASEIDISSVESRRPLLSEIEVHLDPGGQLSPTAISTRPGVVPTSLRELRFGFTSDAIWLQVNAINKSDVTQTRWLSIAHARLEYVDFYQLDASGARIEARWEGGTARPLRLRPIASKESLFPVTLRSGEKASLLVRIQGRSMTAIEANFWEPTHYREHEAAEDLRLLVPSGALAAVGIYLLVSAIYRQDKPFVLLALWLCSAVACELALKGYLYRFLIPIGGEVVTRAPIFFLNTSLALSAAFIHTFLAADSAPVLSKIVRGICLTGAIGVLGSPFADLQLLAMTFIAGIMVLCTIYPFLLVSAWLRAHPNFGLFILALSGLWATTIARMLVMFGIIPPNEVSSTTWSMVYGVGLGCAAILGIVRRAIANHENELDKQLALLRAQQEDKLRLETAIEARTRELQGALIAADEANRAKSDFLARISHDLRAPLTAVLGYADLIIASGGTQADQGRVIRRSARHLLSLLNDLIDYARGGSRPNTLQPLPVYTSSLLRSIAAEGAALAQRNENHFEYAISGELPPVVEVDEKRLRQILINLLDNAAKFTDRGHIRFAVQCHGEPNVDDPWSFIFTIEDDGPGMATAELAHIFEPFRRLKGTENYEGIGLGLAIAKQWVDCMNGHIQVQSTEGKGARICVELSLKPTSEDALSHLHQTCGEDTLPDLDGAGRIIWVVEDSHEIRNLVCADLRSQGFLPIPLANGHDALTMITSSGTQAPHLLVTDLRMPYASGEDVLAKSRSKWPDLPVVLLTATPEAMLSTSNEFSAVLSKPVSLSFLRHTLAKLLGIDCVSPISIIDQPASIVYPDAARLAEALALIDIGAISDLVDWADGLSAENPALADFAAHAKLLAERGDMSSLLRLCGRESLDILHSLKEGDSYGAQADTKPS